MLPGRSGMDVLTSLREAKPGLPVIVLTALGEVTHRVAGLDAGAADYLTVVTSQTALLQAQLQALNLDTLQLTASVDLVRALGGGWQDSALRGSALQASASGVQP